MGLSEDQRREAKEVAYEVAEVIHRRVQESITEIRQALDRAVTDLKEGQKTVVHIHNLECDAKKQIQEIKDDIAAKKNQAKGVAWVAGIIWAIIAAVGGTLAGWVASAMAKH